MAGIILLVVTGYAIYSGEFTNKMSGLTLEGEVLARSQCGSCHQFPSPLLLDKRTWIDHVLPNMGRRMGIQSATYDPWTDLPESQKKRLQELHVYPDSPFISDQEWDAIVDYYANLAPDKLEKSQAMYIESESIAPFQPHYINIEGQEFPQITLLYFDSIQNNLYIGDNTTLYALHNSGVFSGIWSLPSPASDYKILPTGQKAVLTIGSIAPSDEKEGALLISGPDSDSTMNPILQNLSRPVSFSVADLDMDGNEDYIICGFGHHTGSLTWHSASGDTYTLNNLPGTRMAIVQDMNLDSIPDLVVLRAQAQEGVDIYYNEGNGKFTKETILEFSPVHGLSYIELADFNQDGHPDLLITNGDNWDYSPVDKPYHGIRIYLNDGKGRFNESMFYPMQGCSKAIAHDFDKDGDLDIAAIAFYNTDPGKSFVYLENNGRGMYIGHYLPESTTGKWLVMDVGDFDQDGYPDLFLGSYFHNVTEWTRLVATGNTEFPEILYLHNTYNQVQ